MAIRWQALYKGTPAELALEDAVAALGIAYRTQFPGYMYGFRFYPDFLLPTLGVVLEVDDPSHNRAEKILEDADRTEWFETHKGWKVCRTTNEKALTDPVGAVQGALQSIGMWPVPPASSLPHLAQVLPRPQKAPKKARRAARHAATVAKRRGSASRRPRRGSDG